MSWPVRLLSWRKKKYVIARFIGASPSFLMCLQHYQRQGFAPVISQVRTLHAYDHAHLLPETHGVQFKDTSYYTGIISNHIVNEDHINRTLHRSQVDFSCGHVPVLCIRRYIRYHTAVSTFSHYPLYQRATTINGPSVKKTCIRCTRTSRAHSVS